MELRGSLESFLFILHSVNMLKILPYAGKFIHKIERRAEAHLLNYSIKPVSCSSGGFGNMSILFTEMFGRVITV